MQGRLMGKRFQAEFFLESAHKETHSCNYLLATDFEMETVPGYKSTSWAAGYGDYVMKADLGTLRRTPWMEGTALVLADVLDHHHHQDVPHSPRAVLKRQIARLKELGYEAMMASELEFFLFRESYEALQRAGLSRADAGQPLQRGLSHLPDHEGGGCDAGDPHRAERRRDPGRELQGRGECRAGGDQRPLCRRAGIGRTSMRSPRTR